ncbi:unnamed protein product [Brassica oleracea]
MKMRMEHAQLQLHFPNAVENQIDDLASTTKKHCSKEIKMEKKIKVEKIEGE